MSRADAGALATGVGELRRRAGGLCAGLAGGDLSGVAEFLAAREALLGDLARPTALDPAARRALLRDLLGVDTEVLAALERSKTATRRALAEIAGERRWLASAAPPPLRGAFVERHG